MLLAARLGTAPIERAEIYFMDGARAMVERGDYLIPYYRDEPFFDKPPLTYWLMAASFHLFGFTAGAARLVSVAAALGLLSATVWLGTLLLDRRSALAGGVVLATTLAFLTFGRVAMSDMVLALSSTLAVALAVRAWNPGAPPWSLPALGIVLGLGFLTKGPVAVVFPGLAVALLAWQRRRRPFRAQPLLLALAIVLFVIFGLGWFWAVYRRMGPAPLAYFFFRENLERFAGESYDAGQAPWFYLTAYMAVGLPWSPFLLLAALRAWSGEDGHRGSVRFLLGWTVLMLVPLTLSRGKVDYYLLPLYPAASLVVGHHLAGAVWERRDRLMAGVVLILLACGLALLPFSLGRIPDGWLPGPGVRFAAAAMAIAGSLALLGAARRPSPLRVLATVGSCAGVAFLGAVTAYLPAFRAGQPNEAILQDVLRERLFRPDAGLVACRDAGRVQRDILFHARLAVEERCDLWSPASSRQPYLLLLQPEEQLSLAAIPALRVISEHALLSGRDLTLRGFLRGPQPERVSLAANYKTTDPVAESKRRRERKKALLEDESSGADEP